MSIVVKLCSKGKGREVMDSVLSDIATLQVQYQDLADQGKLTESSICVIVTPFREKYCLSDVQALEVARAELTVPQLDALLNKPVA